MKMYRFLDRVCSYRCVPDKLYMFEWIMIENKNFKMFYYKSFIAKDKKMDKSN